MYRDIVVPRAVPALGNCFIGMFRETPLLSTLIVTHEMRFAREIADRVCFFDGGRIVEEGPPEEILSAPRNERTPRLPQGGAGGPSAGREASSSR